MIFKDRLSKRGATALLVGFCVLVALFSIDQIASPSSSLVDEQLLLSGRRLDVKQDHKHSRKLLAVRGVGPELTELDGQAYKLSDIPDQGVTWYKMLSSPKVQWNVAPYSWKNCPKGEHMYLGNTGFTFHEPHPLDPTKTKSKYFRFRLERRDERECMWNFSKSCLSGGSFIMNFGKSAPNMLYPGDYSLKTNDGAVRIVAYNTNRACSIDEPKFSAAPQEILEKRAPIDYLRETVSLTMDPESCKTWIEENKSDDDLFKFNSDMATVHVDTPWMQVIIQVRQNKVATEEKCNYGSMNVWVTRISPDILEDDLKGLFGQNIGTSANRALRGKAMPIDTSKAMEHLPKSVEGKAHVVDGPFGV
jgi:hypothetical protein